ncbi:hypothetical protein QJS10_CPA08g00637 [Acorus calamus]|uniref:MULE transposase domain-containing protein n=1 Tax=Acorus calamus TaxID=4465 RepID=A0AAV9EDE0_ACOCL|nr:hypothetical protein QJS10_CPA08g00637 [Acorus calamus]
MTSFGCLQGCRPFIGLDGCHLKGRYKGILLSSTALDGNDSGETWRWFLKGLYEAIGMVEGLAFMSDMDKGFEAAVPIVYPSAEHHICVRHLYKKLQKEASRRASPSAAACQGWSRHQSGTATKSHYLTNNLSESYNAWINKARQLHIVELVDTIQGMDSNICEYHQFYKSTNSHKSTNEKKCESQWYYHSLICRRILD